MMRFIMHIINIVETRGVVKIQDLANLLKVSVKACFPFGKYFYLNLLDLKTKPFKFSLHFILSLGYPNLTTFIQAFPDVFLYTPSKTNAFRGDVRVNGQCVRKFICFSLISVPFIFNFL